MSDLQTLCEVTFNLFFCFIKTDLSCNTVFLKSQIYGTQLTLCSPESSQIELEKLVLSQYCISATFITLLTSVYSGERVTNTLFVFSPTVVLIIHNDIHKQKFYWTLKRVSLSSSAYCCLLSRVRLEFQIMVNIQPVILRPCSAHFLDPKYISFTIAPLLAY